ncbi:MAG: hypothetical protein ACO1RX_18360 [Candidatus Sericytochromatia bacterium]
MATCAHCQKEIEGLGRRKSLELSSAVYCSKDCLEGLDKSEVKICDVCKKDIGMFDAIYTKGQKFCSPDCAKKGKSPLPAQLGLFVFILIFAGGVFFIFGRGALMVSERRSSRLAQQEIPSSQQASRFFQGTDLDWLNTSEQQRMKAADQFAEAFKEEVGITTEMGTAALAVRIKHCVDEAAQEKSQHSVKDLAAVCVALIKDQL